MREIDRATDAILHAVDAGLPIVSLTGAGISEESGIPTFRGESGIWREHDPETVASYEGFRRDPRLVWQFHERLREMCRDAAPNPAHMALAWLQRALGERCDMPVITQNIDGLHQRAGTREVIELHGNAHRARCERCGAMIERLPDTLEELPPRCDCGGMLRPDVVWFGEQLPRDALERAQRWAEGAGVMLVIGTSCTVQPAASLPIVALRSDATVIEVNPELTAASAVVQVTLRGPAGEVMAELAETVGAELGERTVSGE